MLAQVAIILLLGLQASWAQKSTPAPDLPALPPVPAEAPPLPPLPSLPPAATESPTPPAGEATAPPAPTSEVPPEEAPVDGGSDFLNAEVESLRPTNRDPFAKPKSLIEKEVESVKPTLDPSVYIDMRIEAIRRFPLRNYLLVGIIFDVDNPKAMVKDPENNMHLMTTNQRIGNQEGLIVKIERGELVVEEKGKLVTLKLRK